MFKEIDSCRFCKSKKLTTVLSLGEQFLTGVFPKAESEKISKGPLDLVWCEECSLLQMKQSYSLDEMYGDNYGYRSGLNASMVRHLTHKIRSLEKLVTLKPSDLVIDIGSNDATSLKAYTADCKKVGIDPTGKKFIEFYNDSISLISDFFSASVFLESFPNQKAKLITSIAMFYDLEDPVKFVMDIEAVLAGDGLWHFEQSYMPSMLRTNSYDTICHEHLEFYSFGVVKKILESCGLRIVDVQMNSVNGGSFAVTACKASSKHVSNSPVIDWTLKQEQIMGLNTIKPYKEFAERVYQHRDSLRDLIDALTSSGKKVFGYGASTKGNVLLQFCDISKEQIPCIAEVNEDKFGSFTPGTLIPIVSEADARKSEPDYFLVLPWHFKHGILERERAFTESGGKFIFPMPEIEII